MMKLLNRGAPEMSKKRNRQRQVGRQRSLLAFELMEARQLLAADVGGDLDNLGYLGEPQYSVFTSSANHSYSSVSIVDTGLKPRNVLYKPDDISAYLVNQMLVAQQRSLDDHGFNEVVDEVWSLYQPDRITVKFLDDSGIRAINGQLVDTGQRGTRFAEAYARHNSLQNSDSEQSQQQQLSQPLLDKSVRALLAQLGDAVWVSTTQLSDEEMAELLVLGEKNTGQAMPDIRTQLELQLPSGVSPAQAVDLLNGLPFVELAQPLAVPVSDPAPGDYTPQQIYANDAPDGIGVEYFRATFENRGEGINVVDIENGFNPNHEDLPPITQLRDASWQNGAEHGTAVLGVMGALENNFGVTGLAPGAEYFFSTHRNASGSGHYADAIDAVFEAFNDDIIEPGDVLLWEVQVGGPRWGGNANNQFGLLPVEWRSDIYDRNVIANGIGIIIVAAAGNGRQDLDDEIYNCGSGCNFGHNPFNRDVDSGAIYVGAGTPIDRVRQNFSNFGSRVDLQGWGSGVTTTGYGDLYDDDGDNLFFTSTFSGTSSATPIVASAVTLLNSLQLDYQQELFDSWEVRELLADTGQPQQGNSSFPATQNIGPLPDLRAATLSLGLGSTLVTLLPNNELLIVDQGEKDDSLTLTRNGSALTVHDPQSLIHAHIGTGSGTNAVTIPFSLFDRITVSTGLGDDQLTLDFSGGDVIPAGGIHFDAGLLGDDSLRIVGGSQGTVTYSLDMSSGAVAFSNYGNVTFEGLSPSTALDHYPIRNEGQSVNANFQLKSVSSGASPHFVHNEGLENSTLIGFSGPGIVNTSFLNASNTLTVLPAEADQATVQFRSAPLASSLIVGTPEKPIRHFAVMEAMNLWSNKDLVVNASRSIAVNAGVLASTQGDIKFSSDQTINIAASLSATSGNIELSAPGTNALPGVAAFGGVSISTISGEIRIEADSLLIASTASITTSTGSITIMTHSPGVTIELGGEDVLTDGAEVLGLSSVELSRINTPRLSVGNFDSGPVNVTTAISTFSAISITSGAPINIQELISGNEATVIALGNGVDHALTLEGNGQLDLAASVVIAADSYHDVSTSSIGISAGAGVVTMEPRTSGTEIALGGADVLSGGVLTLGISGDELTRIQAGTLRLGRSNNGATGNIHVTIPVELRSQGIETFELRSGAFVGGPNAAAIDVTDLFVHALMGIDLRGDNDVDVLAMHSVGAGGAQFTDIDDFEVGSVAGFNGITALNQPISLTAQTGTITVLEAVISDGVDGSTSIIAGQSVDIAANVFGGAGGVTIVGQGSAAESTTGVLVRDGATVSSLGTGPVVVDGSGGGGAASGSYGVHVTGGQSRITSAGGDVQVIGNGGSGSEGFRYGVRVDAGGEITAGPTAHLEVSGTGGEADGFWNIGVYVGPDSRIHALSSLTVNGTGGGTVNSGSNRGVWVNTGATISTGNGLLTVNGVGGLGASGFNRGVFVQNTGIITSTNGGNVIVSGSGGGSGSSSNDMGVNLSSGGRISATQAGTVSVTGTAGTGSGTNSFGVRVQGTNSRITSAGGAIHVTGYANATSPGVRVETPQGILAAEDSSIVIATDSLVLTPSPLGTIEAPQGILTIQPVTPNTPIKLGGDDILAGADRSLGLSSAELDQLDAEILRIGNLDSGTIEVLAAFSPANINRVHLRSGDQITGDQPVTVQRLALTAEEGIDLQAAGNNVDVLAVEHGAGGEVRYVDADALVIDTVDTVIGVNSSASLTRVETLDGSLSVFASSIVNGDASRLELEASTGINVAANVSSSGDMVLTGRGESSSGVGVQITSATVSTTDGNIRLDGQGGSGSGSSNHGVRVSNSLVLAGGDGGVQVSGDAGGGSFSSGVIVTGTNAAIVSEASYVNVWGYGRALGTGFNRGVWLTSGGTIYGSSSVFISGSSGSHASANNEGVFVFGEDTEITSDGNIVVRGIGSTTSFGIRVQSDASISTTGAGQQLTLQTDSLDIPSASPGTIGSVGNTVIVRPWSSFHRIDVGGDDIIVGNQRFLGLSDAELDRFIGEQVVVGHSLTSNVEVTNSISHANHLHLVSGLSYVSINAPVTLSTGKTFSIDARTISQTAAVNVGSQGRVQYLADGNIDIGSSITAGTGGIEIESLGELNGDFNGIDIHSGAVVRTTGSGEILLRGKGGAGDYTLNHGIEIRDDGTRVQTFSGLLTLDGTGGGGEINVGVNLHSRAVVTSSFGQIDINGTAGLGPESPGFVMSLNSQVASSGDIEVTAAANQVGNQRPAFDISFGSEIIGVLTSDVTINANTVSINSTGTIDSENGKLTIQPLTEGTPINVGGSDSLVGGSEVLGLSALELDRLRGRVIRIGNRDSIASGPITISDDLVLSSFDTLHLRTGSDVSGGGTIDIDSLAISATTGVELTEANRLGTVAIHNNQSGPVTLNEIDGITVGVVDAVSGIGASSQQNTVALSVTAGLLEIDAHVQAFGTDGSINLSAPAVLVRAPVNGGEEGVAVNGTGSDDFNVGVQVEETGIITATNGNVVVQGTSRGLVGDNKGVWVRGNGQGNSPKISAVGGAVTVVGEAPIGPANSAGVMVSGGGSIGTTIGASVSVTGIAGGTAANAVGVMVTEENSTIIGNAGVGVTASGPGGGLVLREFGSIVSTSSAPVTITTDSLLIDGPDANSLGSIQATGAQLSIVPQTSGTLLNLGGDDVLTGSPKTLGLSASEIDQISAATLLLGNTTTGPVTVSQAIAPENVTDLVVVGGTSIEVDAPITMGIDGRLSLDAQQNVRVVDNLQAGSGGLQLVGRGIQDINSNGVSVHATIEAVNDGNISILGYGGAGTGSNYGVYLAAAQVHTAGSGNIVISGYGGTGGGNANYGLRIASTSTSQTLIETESGSISLTGQGGGSGSGTANRGILIASLIPRIAAGFGGDIVVNGQGGTGSSATGIALAGIIETVNGDITLQGSGGDADLNSNGIHLSNGTVRSIGTGTIQATAFGTDLSAALRLDNDSLLQTADRTIAVSADSIQFGGGTLGRIDAGEGIANIRPITPGTELRIGGADVLSGETRALGLTSAELARITAGELRLGNTDTGRIHNSTNHIFDYPQVTIRNGNADIEAIGGWAFTGDFFAESGGSIFQGNNELSVAGLAHFRAEGDVLLDGTGDPNGNQFNDLFVAGETIFIREAQDGFNFVGAQIDTALTIDSPFVVTQSAPLSGNGGLSLSSNTPLILDQVNTYTGLTTVGDDAMLSIDGEIPGNVELVAGGVLSGNGTVGGDVNGLGSLRPGSDFGAGLGALRVNGSTNMSGEAVLELQGDDVAGEDYDQLVAGQGVDLSAVTAEFTGAFAGQPTQPLQIVDNQSATATIPFSNLAEGATVVVDDITFTISYLGGDGNDVVLQPVETNQPPTAVRLENALAEINENTAVSTRLKVADIVIDDDGLGENQLSLSGPQADSFEIDGLELFLRAGVVLDYETLAALEITIEVDDPDVGSTPDASVDYALTVLDLAEVAGVTVGDGAVQRSRVEQLVVTFDGEVDIAVGAFTVYRRALGNDAGGVVNSTFTTEVINGATVATLTFSGSSTRGGGALIDGNYELQIDASKVTRDGQALDGDQDGNTGGDYEFGTEPTDAFFAMFGDTNGDRAVGFVDFLAFRSTFGKDSNEPGYLRWFDFEDNGAVGFTDFLQFRGRFGSQLGFE